MLGDDPFDKFRGSTNLKIQKDIEESRGREKDQRSERSEENFIEVHVQQRNFTTFQEFQRLKLQVFSKASRVFTTKAEGRKFSTIYLKLDQSEKYSHDSQSDIVQVLNQLVILIRAEDLLFQLNVFHSRESPRSISNQKGRLLNGEIVHEKACIFWKKANLTTKGENVSLNFIL